MSIFQSKKVSSSIDGDILAKTMNKTPRRTTEGPDETAWSEGGYKREDSVSGSQDVKVVRGKSTRFHQAK